MRWLWVDAPVCRQCDQQHEYGNVKQDRHCRENRWEEWTCDCCSTLISREDANRDHLCPRCRKEEAEAAAELELMGIRVVRP